jgi:hypothetical protein
MTQSPMKAKGIANVSSGGHSSRRCTALLCLHTFGHLLIGKSRGPRISIPPLPFHFHDTRSLATSGGTLASTTSSAASKAPRQKSTRKRVNTRPPRRVSRELPPAVSRNRAPDASSSHADPSTGIRYATEVAGMSVTMDGHSGAGACLRSTVASYSRRTTDSRGDQAVSLSQVYNRASNANRDARPASRTPSTSIHAVASRPSGRARPGRAIHGSLVDAYAAAAQQNAVEAEGEEGQESEDMRVQADVKVQPMEDKEEEEEEEEDMQVGRVPEPTPFRVGPPRGRPKARRMPASMAMDFDGEAPSQRFASAPSRPAPAAPSTTQTHVDHRQDEPIFVPQEEEESFSNVKILELPPPQTKSPRLALPSAAALLSAFRAASSSGRKRLRESDSHDVAAQKRTRTLESHLRVVPSSSSPDPLQMPLDGNASLVSPVKDVSASNSKATVEVADIATDYHEPMNELTAFNELVPLHVTVTSPLSTVAVATIHPSPSVLKAPGLLSSSSSNTSLNTDNLSLVNAPPSSHTSTSPADDLSTADGQEKHGYPVVTVALPARRVLPMDPYAPVPILLPMRWSGRPRNIKKEDVTKGAIGEDGPRDTIDVARARRNKLCLMAWTRALSINNGPRLLIRKAGVSRPHPDAAEAFESLLVDAFGPGPVDRGLKKPRKVRPGSRGVLARLTRFAGQEVRPPRQRVAIQRECISLPA